MRSDVMAALLAIATVATAKETPVMSDTGIWFFTKPDHVFLLGGKSRSASAETTVSAAN